MKRFLLAMIATLCLCTYSSGLLAEDGFKSLFNGKDLTGWKGLEGYWNVEDEAITGTTNAETPLTFNTFLVWEDGEVDNFVLELDYRLRAGDEANPGGNSGIQYRSKLLDDEKFVVGGYQADIDLSLTYSGINYEERGRGILAQRGERVTIAKDGTKSVEKFGDAGELGKVIRGGEWNQYRVVAQGNRLRHYINDTLMSEVIDAEESKSAAKGILAFQIHTGPPMKIQFKNIRLKAE
jgi:hypothetical protein